MEISGKPIRKKNSASILTLVEQITIASNVDNMYTQLWCYCMLLFGVSCDRWIFFRGAYLIFQPSDPSNPIKISLFATSSTWKKCPSYTVLFSANIKKAKKIGRKSNWLCNVHISKNFLKCYFFVAHPMISKN